MLAVDGVPYELPTKAIPHWWGPTALVRATWWQALLVWLPHQGSTGRSSPSGLATLGRLARFPCRSRSPTVPQAPQLARQFPLCGGGVRGFWVYPPGPTLALAVVAKRRRQAVGAAPLVQYCSANLGDRCSSELSRRALSGCCCPSV